jgi:hypothetical protein
MIQRHILQIETFESPYKIIAADANNDMVLSTFDLVLLSSLILGSIEEISTNTSWRFIPSDYVFSDPDNPLLENWPNVKGYQGLVGTLEDENWVAMKVGDVSGDAGASGSRISRDVVAVTYEFEHNPGGELEIIFRPVERMIYAGYQMEIAIRNIDFDLLMLDLNHSSLENKLESNVLFDLERNLIRVNWYNGIGQELGPEDELFRVSLPIQNLSNTKEINLSLEQSGQRWDSEIYDIDQRVYHVNLQEAAKPSEGIISHANHPNPFSERTSIIFELTSEMKVQIDVFDAGGRFLGSFPHMGSAGLNHFNLEGSDFPMGVLHYRIYTDSWNSSGKLIKAE